MLESLMAQLEFIFKARKQRKKIVKALENCWVSKAHVKKEEKSIIDLRIIQLILCETHQNIFYHFI